MSRTPTDKLFYFPLDTDFFLQPAMRRMVKRYCTEAPAMYLYLLCCIYGGQGYYVEESQDLLEDAACDLNLPPEEAEDVLEELVERSLLRRCTLNGTPCLSSRDIQAQYQRSVRGRKRKVTVEPELWLLDRMETEPFIVARPGTVFPWGSTSGGPPEEAKPGPPERDSPGEKDISPGEKAKAPGEDGVPPGEKPKRKEKKENKINKKKEQHMKAPPAAEAKTGTGAASDIRDPGSGRSRVPTPAELAAKRLTEAQKENDREAEMYRKKEEAIRRFLEYTRSHPESNSVSGPPPERGETISNSSSVSSSTSTSIS